ncbi:bacillithiol biosynthesis cysteine-adding enzyme BshC [Paraflavisolibacter sp. H34]|uniref:bacillithiol biosynthesis cysteine-adding enzyme BshC n=1 Tax=Huijunlia imazamoxiresistens TaxID=3127457 RepID=UPI00301A2816
MKILTTFYAQLQTTKRKLQTSNPYIYPMLFEATYLPYHQTNKFSPLVLDYLALSPAVKPFYTHPPTPDGLRRAVEAKAQHKIDRELLVNALLQQYAGVGAGEEVLENIRALASEKTFTVTTAHQPNIFTGPLYFIYKILHAIKLAACLHEQLPAYRFVPVYYMGSEDADFAELNHTYVNGHRIEWQKEQSGAVGRMRCDKNLTRLICELEGQLSIEAYGAEVIALLKRCYTEGKTVQEATFELVNELYGKYGLVVLIPDNADLKRRMIPIFEDDLFGHTPSAIVRKTSEALEQQYNAQAHPRDINLFYLKDNLRERILREEGGFLVNNTDIRFTEAEMKAELQQHPDRFSPNVILRGLFQETLLPNVAFIGGGGELAYWLQLKDLFVHYGVPFPVLVLRNSFMVIELKWQLLIDKLQLSDDDLFLAELTLQDVLMERQGKRPKLNGEWDKVEELYKSLLQIATAVDTTLQQHISSLKAKTLKQLTNLEKKLLRAERKKGAAEFNQVAKIRQELFPRNGLQERAENFSSFYARHGRDFFDALYDASLCLEQEFTILRTRDKGAISE